jgi:hypothetical protein
VSATITVRGTNTHRDTCTACGATVILAATVPADGTTVAPARYLDATATVARGAYAAALPLLPALVAWECPACDTRQMRDA